MKKLIIILVILLLLGGGAGAAWWFYFRPDAEATTEAAPPPTLTQIIIPDNASSALSVSVIKNGKNQRTFFFRLTLIFDAPEKQATAERMMPLLMNDINIELHVLMARKLVEESDFNQKFIEQRLKKVIDRRLGDGVVYQVSIANMEAADPGQ
jgi:flagellar protein FliL